MNPQILTILALLIGALVGAALGWLAGSRPAADLRARFDARDAEARELDGRFRQAIVELAGASERAARADGLADELVHARAEYGQKLEAVQREQAALVAQMQAGHAEQIDVVRREREALRAELATLRANAENFDEQKRLLIAAREEMLTLQEILAPTNVVLISDEVYEHMVYDGQQHQSAARFPGLVERAFVVSSFGKTYHVTGWKVGYVAAPAALTQEFRKVHQFNVFTVNTPVQYGLAAYMAHQDAYLNLPDFYQEKRDLFRAGLKGSKFRLLPCEGTYFQCVDTSQINDLKEADFCKWLTSEIGVAAIPLSAFYGAGFDQQVVRFCFAKKTDTLRLALEKLQRL